MLKGISGSSTEVVARERLAATILEKFSIDTVDMRPNDRKELAFKQLEERRRRMTLILLLIAFLAICTTAVTVIAIIQNAK